MIPVPHHVRRLLPGLAMLLFFACAKESHQDYGGFFDTSGVPLSEELRPAVEAALTRLAQPPVDTQGARDMARYWNLDLDIFRHEERQRAGDELYALWREDPTHFLWIDLGARLNYLLRRTRDRNAMYALPELADSNRAIGCYVRGRRFFGYSDRDGIHYLAAEERSEELDPLQTAWLQYRLADVDASTGRGLAAARRLLSRLAFAHEVAGWRLEYLYWKHVALSLLKADRLDDALHAAALAGSIAEAGGSARRREDAKLTLARVLSARREYEAAMAMFEACQKVAVAHGYNWLGTKVMHDAALVCAKLGETRRQLAFHRGSLQVSRAARDSINMQGNLMNVASQHLIMGRLDSCRACLDEALLIARISADNRHLYYLTLSELQYANAVGDYGLSDSLLGEFTGDISSFGFANQEVRLQLKLLGQALDAGEIDRAYGMLARLDELSSKLVKTDADFSLMTDIELAKAGFLRRQGEFSLARACLAKAVDISRESGAGIIPWDYYILEAELALVAGDLASARQSLETALAVALNEERADRLEETRNRLGHVLLEQGEFELAREQFPPPGSEGDFGGGFRTKLSGRLLRAISHAREGRHDLAAEDFRAVERDCLPRTPKDLLIRLHLELGRSLLSQGEAPGAEDHLLRALELIRLNGDKVLIDELRAFNRGVKREAIELLLRLYFHHPDLCGEFPGAWRGLLLVAELHAAGAWSAEGSDPAFLPPGRILVYFIGERESFLWHLNREHIIQHPLPGRREIQRRLRPVLAEMRQADSPRSSAAALSLAETLFGSLSIDWSAGDTLYLLADDFLSDVPWACLPLPGEDAETCLLDYGPIIILPSLAVLNPAARPDAQIDEHEAPRRLLALGVDAFAAGESGGAPRPLRHAEAEASAVAELWSSGPAELLLGRRADWSSLGAPYLAAFDVIHVATHAVASSGAAGGGTLRFSSGQGTTPVSAEVIVGLDLNAELVFLSCCEAAQAAREPGSSAMNLTRAFLEGGARSVIASSARVDDEAARFLAERFYLYWQKGDGKAEALRAAQMDVRTDEHWRHPFFWAPYQLVMDGP